MNKKAIRLCVSSLLMIIAIAFTQCGKPFGAKGELQYSQNGVARGVAGGVEASVEAFSTTVYPMTRQHCVSCHAVAQQPVHASPDVTTAHNALVNQFKVNLANPSSSRIVQKLRENHQCWGSCADNATQMQLAIETWANDLGDAATPDPTLQYDFTTISSQTIDLERQNGELDANGRLTLSFSLNPKINIFGARLEVKLEDYDEFSYRLTDLRLIVANRYVYVKGIRLLLNNQFSPQNANFTYIDQMVNPANNMLSPSSMIVLKDQGDTQDKIAFAFDKLELRGDPAQSLAAFQQTVYTITRQYCVSCHATTQRPFHASNSAQTAHDDLINRYMIDFQNPQFSRIVEKLEERHNCWSGNCTNDAQQMRNAIQAWGQMIGN